MPPSPAGSIYEDQLRILAKHQLLVDPPLVILIVFISNRSFFYVCILNTQCLSGERSTKTELFIEGAYINWYQYMCRRCSWCS